MIRILPRPQHIEEREGRLLLDYHCRITMDSSCPSEVFFYASQLAEQLKKSSGIELLIDRRTSCLLYTSLGSTIYTTQDISAITDALLKEYSSAQILSTSSISTLKTKLEKAARHDLDSNFSLAYQDKNDLEVSVLDAYLMVASDARCV